jgi:hypothetical protein
VDGFEALQDTGPIRLASEMTDSSILASLMPEKRSTRAHQIITTWMAAARR